MDKPRCQGCLGELKVERPEGSDPYVWCLRCGARDDREPQELISLLEQNLCTAHPRESAGTEARHAPKAERIEHSHAIDPSGWNQHRRSPTG
ncbi:hypothetical protein RKE25_11535 [Dyella sp. BiH032]|uniref:hypothetical protein n=1 Tax=Dyella sp. BiH032 TaxID=3075430 RepID=UPI002892C757|nr:hypothetical protein [Dyella sp. BiH032]WNL44062.1 hypothetical protein RKE25_11535 [Dyella sp. BiH032]